MAQRRTDDEQEYLLSNSPRNQTSSQTQSTSPETQPTTTTFRFESSSQFRLLRFLLRLLSLWCPRSAYCFERWLYPLIVNLLLLAMVVLPLFWNSWQLNSLLAILVTSVYSLINMSAWLSHIAAVVYFRYRDVEDNMTNIVLPEIEINVFRKKLMYFNLRIAASLVMVPLYCYFTITLWPWSKTLDGVFVHSLVQRLAALASSPYLAGMYVSILWVIDLLHITARARLRNQYLKFQTWKEIVDVLILNHTENYTAKVRKSCRLLRYWFGIHNNFLFVILLTFLLIYITDLFDLRRAIVFVGLTSILVLVWALPFYFISELQNNEERFCSEVTEFRVVSPGVALMTDADNNFNAEHPQNLTFSLRSNLEVFAFFLKEVKPSFPSARYISQLQTALLSIYLTFLAFVVKWLSVSHES